MSASKKSSRISRPPRRPLDDDYTWESLGALTADLAGMSADMAELGSSPFSFVGAFYKTQFPNTELLRRRRLVTQLPCPNVELQNLAQAAQAASPNPPQDLDFRRLLLAKETQMIEVEKLKLQLELARIQASSNFHDFLTNPLQAKPHDPSKIFGRPSRPAANMLYPATMAAHSGTR